MMKEKEARNRVQLMRYMKKLVVSEPSEVVVSELESRILELERILGEGDE